MSATEPNHKASRNFVLVADDDPLFHLLIGHMLAKLGLAPLLVADGAAAIAAVEAHGSELQGAILDIDMPNIDGIDAAHAIQRIAPELAIMLMSGAVPRDYADRTTHLHLAGTLQKPFSPAAFHALIWHALADRAARGRPIEVKDARSQNIGVSS